MNVNTDLGAKRAIEAINIEDSQPGSLKKLRGEIKEAGNGPAYPLLSSVAHPVRQEDALMADVAESVFSSECPAKTAELPPEIWFKIIDLTQDYSLTRLICRLFRDHSDVLIKRDCQEIKNRFAVDFPILHHIVPPQSSPCAEFEILSAWAVTAAPEAGIGPKLTLRREEGAISFKAQLADVQQRVEKIKLRDSLKLDHALREIHHLTPESITFDSLQLNFLNESIWQLTSLESLNLESNELTCLPDAISKLHRLKELSLSSNHLSSLPAGISCLTCLRELRASGNNIRKLSEGIGKLKYLEELHLRNNKLTTLPEEISSLTSLRLLVAADNMLDMLPNGIEGLVSLTKLDLAKNKLETLPERFRSLTALRVLFLNENKFTSVPMGLGRLSSLRVLRLDRNDINAIHDSISWVMLEHLNLDLCSVRLLPDGMSRLTSLRSLHLCDSSLDDLPVGMSRLTNLEELAIGCSRLHPNDVVTPHLCEVATWDCKNNCVKRFS